MIVYINHKDQRTVTNTETSSLAIYYNACKLRITRLSPIRTFSFSRLKWPVAGFWSCRSCSYLYCLRTVDGGVSARRRRRDAADTTARRRRKRRPRAGLAHTTRVPLQYIVLTHLIMRTYYLCVRALAVVNTTENFCNWK